MLEKIVSKISANKPKVLGLDFPEAAVLFPVTDEEEPKIILTRRSERMRTHGGQVAFPGGMKDQADNDLKVTALRESKEEVGLNESAVEIIGCLNQVVSKYRITVSPYVGLVDPQAELTPCPNELDAVFKVPIAFFLDSHPDRIDQLGFDQYRIDVPCWYFGEYQIWGMSAIILTDFFRVVFDLGFGSSSLRTV